jgi:hypothetical protein
MRYPCFERAKIKENELRANYLSYYVDMWRNRLFQADLLSARPIAAAFRLVSVLRDFTRKYENKPAPGREKTKYPNRNHAQCLT